MPKSLPDVWEEDKLVIARAAAKLWGVIYE